MTSSTTSSTMFGSRRRPLSDIGNTLQTVPNLSHNKEPFRPALIPTPALGGSSSSHQALPNPQSPHFDDRNQDPQCVSTYASDIISNLTKREVDLTATGYMTRQQFITPKMRSILVDWMVDVHNKFGLHTEALYLSVNLVDRFLEKREVTRDNLQLVGVVAMLLAAKYEEIYPPEISRFIHISANTYTRDQVLSWEKQMLKALDFNLTVPTIYPFLKRGLSVSSSSVNTEMHAKFFAESCLSDYNVMQFRPSHIAAACIHLARKMEGADSWDPSVEYYLKLKKEEVSQCTEAVLASVKASFSNPKTQAVKKKFSSRKYGSVGKLRIEELTELEHN